MRAVKSLLWFFAMFPLLCLQVIWVQFRAARLPEALGPRRGEAGQGQSLRVLIVGDSSAAGVGAKHQNDALAGRLVARLSTSRHVIWRLEAESGATTTSALGKLARLEPEPFDVAVIALGVNDSKNGMKIKKWESNYQSLIDLLKERFSVRLILASGVPPLGEFPLLPVPLRSMLGARAILFEGSLKKVCEANAGVCHVPLDFPMDTSLMAEDGFHPGPIIYDRWAERLAQEIV